ncbi:MAG: hypothetical protein ACRDWI_04130 [Jiangellaceae bacterium]
MSTKEHPRNRRDKIIFRAVTPLGLLVLLLTWFGNAAGVVILPLDQHHVIGQVVGFGLIAYGLMHWR